MSPELLAQVLIPYRDHCKYLKSVSMGLSPSTNGASQCVVGEGVFSIGDSCYIDSTGHFNAVEFQICANQLLYAMGAECVRRDLLAAFSSMNMDGYFERQLPNVLITNVTSTFRKVLNPREFRGQIRIDRAYRMKTRAFWECSVTYSDDEDGLADGTVVVTMELGEKLAPKV